MLEMVSVNAVGVCGGVWRVEWGGLRRGLSFGDGDDGGERGIRRGRRRGRCLEAERRGLELRGLEYRSLRERVCGLDVRCRGHVCWSLRKRHSHGCVLGDGKTLVREVRS